MKAYIPATVQSYYNSTQANANKLKMQSIYSNYKAIIDNISSLSRVDKSIIIAIIMAESGGNAAVISGSGAVGLMQIKPATAHDAIALESIKKRLLPAEETILIKYLGASKVACLKQQKYLSHKLPCNNNTGTGLITQSDLVKPELNILIGAIALGMRIDQEATEGNLRLERALLRYNQGYFFKPKGTNFTEVLNSLKQGSEAYNYLLKIMGTNGLIEVQLT